MRGNEKEKRERTHIFEPNVYFTHLITLRTLQKEYQEEQKAVEALRRELEKQNAKLLEAQVAVEEAKASLDAAEQAYNRWVPSEI